MEKQGAIDRRSQPLNGKPPLGYSNYQSLDVEEPNGDAVGQDLPNMQQSRFWWRKDASDVSLPEMHRTVQVPELDEVWWKKLMAYAGPGALVAVGYMDPGNWSTDIGGGSAYNYDLLFVVMLSSVVAVFLQALSIKMGIASERDLAQACRDRFSAWVVNLLWVVAEVAIIATDLAEVLGSAIALQLLFGWPLLIGVLVTVVDVVFVLIARGNQVRFIEFLVVVLILIITVSFGWQLILSKPSISKILHGTFVPTIDTLTDSNKLFLAVSILGATVMPHSLFLHSSMVLTRASGVSRVEKLEAVKYSIIDTSISLFFAFFVNAAILVVAAATFYHYGFKDVADLADAYHLMDPLLGNRFASIAFGVALLAAGLNSTLTGTISGQIVMEGFMHWSIDPVFRRLITRGLAIVPAVVVIVVGGEGASNNLLLLSQVVLSFALPFAVFPLVWLTSDVDVMGPDLVNGKVVTYVAYAVAWVITVLNLVLLVCSFTQQQ